MAVYLVGPDDTSLFHKRTTWDFDQALEKAADGDTIEIQQGFSPQTDQIIRLKKNITIQGHVQINTETNHRLFTNTIGAIFVSNQAQVTLKDICIQITSEKSNAINVKGASNVIAQRVLVESLAQEGVNYPVIYAEDNSKIDFYDVTAQPSKIADGNFSAFILDSTLTVANSWLGCRISLSHSAASLKEVTVVYHESNALYMEKESTATVIDSWLDGGKVTEKSNWPCVRVLDSKLTLTNSSVLQPNFNAALSGKNATFTIDQGNLDSVALMSSVAHISQVTISESLAIKAQSVLQATTIFIKGIANGNINLFGNQQSKIQADQIYFGMLTDPNIKMEQDVDLDVGTFKQLAYNQTNHTFIKNEKNLYTITADAGKIVFWGEACIGTTE